MTTSWARDNVSTVDIHMVTTLAGSKHVITLVNLALSVDMKISIVVDVDQNE